MKKIISGVLSAVILTSVLCACNDGGNQSNSSQSGNNADSSQQTVTTEVATTQTTRTQTMLHRFHPKIKPISLKKFHSMMRQPQADIRLMIVNSEYIMQVCKVDA
jgi:hypothetical protein